MKVAFFALPFCFLCLHCAAQLPDKPQPQGFLHNRFNQTLVVSDVTVRALDALSTRQAVTDPCRCLFESGNLFGQNLKPVAEHAWSQYSYSLGFAAMNVLISRVLWDRAERKHRAVYHVLARAILAADLGTDGYATVHNWVQLSAPRKNGFHRFEK